MTPPTSLHAQPVANAIAAVLDAIAPELWVPMEAGACKWSPKDLDSVPAACIEVPTIRRPEPDEIDATGIGSNGWVLEFPVTFYFDLSEAAYSQTEAVAYVDAAILAIDANRGLGIATVIDTAMVAAEPTIIKDDNRALIAYECQVHVLKAVPIL